MTKNRDKTEIIIFGIPNITQKFVSKGDKFRETYQLRLSVIDVVNNALKVLSFATIL